MAELYSFGSHGFKNSFGLLRYYYNENNELRTDKVTIMSESLLSPEKSLKLINELDYKAEKNEIKLTLFSNYIMNYVFQRPIGLFGTIRGPMPYFIFDQNDVLFIGSDFTIKREFSKKFNSSLALIVSNPLPLCWYIKAFSSLTPITNSVLNKLIMLIAESI